MRMSSIAEERLEEFLGLLARFGTLHGPTVSDLGVTSFAALASPADLVLDYRRTLIPPKKYLLPFREPVLIFNDGIYGHPREDHRDLVLIGLHRCDLQGLRYLDRVFLGENPDPGYARRRKRLTLVGLSCEPDEFCFCNPNQEAPCDLFLHRIEGGYLISSHSKRGTEVVRAGAELLRPSELSPAPPAHGASAPPSQDPQTRFSENPLWEEYALTCVSCGACSACCPTCYCFDVREYPDLDSGGKRIREWDNCLFKKHGEVAGGDFRRTRLERLRYRFLHKYCGFSPLEGIISCVGCGRCKEVCPVDIDLRNVTVTPGGQRGGCGTEGCAVTADRAERNQR